MSDDTIKIYKFTTYIVGTNGFISTKEQIKDKIQREFEDELIKISELEETEIK